MSYLCNLIICKAENHNLGIARLYVDSTIADTIASIPPASSLTLQRNSMSTFFIHRTSCITAHLEINIIFCYGLFLIRNHKLLQILTARFSSQPLLPDCAG